MCKSLWMTTHLRGYGQHRAKVVPCKICGSESFGYAI